MSYLLLLGTTLRMEKEKHKMTFKQQNNVIIAHNIIPCDSLILTWVSRIIIGPSLLHSFKYSKNCRQ